MFNRIFGGTDAEQLQFLEVRSIITIAALVIAGVASFFTPNALSLIAIVMLFIWGWNVIKNWFGFTTLGAIFSGNVVIGVVIFMFCLLHSTNCTLHPMRSTISLSSVTAE